MTARLATDPGAFPADPPSDPDSAGAIATHDWAAQVEAAGAGVSGSMSP